MTLGQFPCPCGGTVPVPNQLFHPPSETLRAICTDVCGRVWEFTYDKAGGFSGNSPQLAQPASSPAVE